jgi:hypothetical protein
MITLDEALETVSQLPAEQREMLEQILHRRRIDEQRREWAQNARESAQAFHAGQGRPQSAEEVIAELRVALLSPGEG